MRKVLSGLMVLILLLLFAVTYVNSKQTEEVFRAQIERLNQSQPGLLQVELVQYRRSLLVSSARTSVRLKETRLPLQHQIRHFPWKARLQTRLADDAQQARHLTGLLPPEQLQLTTDIALDGASQSRCKLPELNYANENYQLQLAGLSFRTDLNGQLSGGTLDLQLDRLTFSEPGKVELQLTELQLESQFLEQQGLPLGQGELSLGSLSIDPESGNGLELEQLRYAVETDQENELLSSGLKLQLASISAAGERFDNAEIQLQVAGIAAAAVREMLLAARQMQAELSEQQLDPLVFQLQMLGLYSQLLAEGLSVALDRLSLQADGGQLEGQGQLQLAGGRPGRAGLFSFNNLNGALQLEIDQTVFNAGFRLFNRLQRPDRKVNRAVQNELAEQLAGGLIQKGILTRREEGGYRLKLSLEQGQGELNEIPFQL